MSVGGGGGGGGEGGGTSKVKSRYLPLFSCILASLTVLSDEPGKSMASSPVAVAEKVSRVVVPRAIAPDRACLLILILAGRQRFGSTAEQLMVVILCMHHPLCGKRTLCPFLH
jgi:hypothetical protein